VVDEAIAEIVLASGQELRHDFHIELPTGFITGRVTRQDGTPASGLEVNARAERPAGSLIWNNSSRTHDQGGYVVTVPRRGTFRVSVADGGVESVRPGIAAGTEGVDFVLPEMGQLLFRVLQRETGEPVDLTSLSWRPAGRGEYESVHPETQERGFMDSRPLTDSQGFRRVRLPIGSVDLHLYAGQAGFQSARRENVPVRGEGEPERVTFELERGVRVHIQLDPPGRLPPGTFVALPPAELWSELSCTLNERGNNRLSFGGVHPATGIGRLIFGDDGRASMRGLAPGRYRLKVFHVPVRLEPEEVVVTARGPGSAEEPFVVRWRME
jgi:hypothetical protein